MVTPPFELFNYYAEEKDEKCIIYFLSEGANSERLFYEYLFYSRINGFIRPDGVLLKEIRKTEFDQGLSDGLALVKKAIEWCNDSKNNFDKTKDAIVITFDLDRFSKEDIDELVRIKEPYILYAFSNPKFELVQLLSLMDDLSKLEEEYYDLGTPNNILENAFSSLTHTNSKTRKSGNVVASNYNQLMKHRAYDESDISKAKDKFCTNVLNVLDIIQKWNK